MVTEQQSPVNWHSCASDMHEQDGLSHNHKAEAAQKPFLLFCSWHLVLTWTLYPLSHPHQGLIQTQCFYQPIVTQKGCKSPCCCTHSCAQRESFAFFTESKIYYKRKHESEHLSPSLNFFKASKLPSVAHAKSLMIFKSPHDLSIGSATSTPTLIICDLSVLVSSFHDLD